MSWLDRAYLAVFDRKQEKHDVDLAHFVVPTVSLTMLSALVGANASKLPDNHQTTWKIVAAILSLSVFYSIMQLLWESIRNKQWTRSTLIALTAFFLSSIFAQAIASISGNRGIVDGIFYGWLFSFMFMAFFFSNADGHSIEKPKSDESQAEKVND
jgi:hypothetical protein